MVIQMGQLEIKLKWMYSSSYISIHILSKLLVQSFQNTLVNDIRSHTTVQTDEYKTLFVIGKGESTSLQSQVNSCSSLTRNSVSHKINFNSRSSDVVNSCKIELVPR